MITLLRTATVCCTMVPLLSLVGAFPDDDSEADDAARTTREAPGPQAGQALADKQLASWLMISNQGEVTLGKFAQRRAEHPEVKEFAAMMVKDHTAFIEKLHKAGVGVGIEIQGTEAAADVDGPDDDSDDPDDADDSDDADDPDDADDSDDADDADDADDSDDTDDSDDSDDADDSDKPKGAASVVTPHGVDLIRLKHELGQQCLSSIQAALEKKEGAEFDQAYMTYMVVAHLEMLDTLKVFQKHVSPNLKPVLGAGAKTTAMHMEHALKLLREVEDARTTSTAGGKTKIRKK